MTQGEFEALIERFSAAATAGDGEGFAACFTPGGVYHHAVHGDHVGREEIADLLQNGIRAGARDLFWWHFDPVVNGRVGYAWSVARLISDDPRSREREVVLETMARFGIEDGLIADYRDVANDGAALAQLGVAPESLSRAMARAAGNLAARPDIRRILEALRGR